MDEKIKGSKKWEYCTNQSRKGYLYFN